MSKYTDIFRLKSQPQADSLFYGIKAETHGLLGQSAVFFIPLAVYWHDVIPLSPRRREGGMALISDFGANVL